jgi:hypothetical protein
MANKATVVLGSECYSRHYDNLKKIFGDSNMPNIDTLSTLTVNYTISLAQDISFLTRLRALLEIAEDEGVQFSLGITNDEIAEFSEGLQVLKDLKFISEERKRKELWSEK